MRPGQLAFAVCAAGLTWAAAAHADDDEESGRVPAAFERVELSDSTFTLRDDTFTTLTTDPADPRTAYVGTVEGRIYKTTDSGRTWTESTVLTQPGLTWATPGSSIYFGSIRKAGGSSKSIDLAPARPSPLDFPYVPAELGPTAIDMSHPAYNAFDTTQLPFSFPKLDPLAGESAISAGGQSSPGAGLSARSPRVSSFAGLRRRPLPAVNRLRFLADYASHGTEIVRIRSIHTTVG